MNATKKIGRPTEAKKDFMLRTRIEPEILKKLEIIAEKEKISKSEVVRRGIEIQYENLEEK